jgi:hypothetical protein
LPGRQADRPARRQAKPKRLLRLRPFRQRRAYVIRALCAMIVTASQFAAYDQFKHAMIAHGMADGPLTHILGGFMAGVVASITSTPVDVVKTRIKLRPGEIGVARRSKEASRRRAQASKARLSCSSASWNGSASASAGSMASENSNVPSPRRLVRAAEAGNAQLVARLLGEGRDVNKADEDGCTALIYAAFLGHVELVRLLLARLQV